MFFRKHKQKSLDFPTERNFYFAIECNVFFLTISTTFTSASMRNWYMYCSKSRFISTELSSSWATVNNRIRHRAHTLLRFNRKAIRNRRPPSWIIHQMSIVPSWISFWSGKLSIFFGTITAHWRASAMAIVPMQRYFSRNISDRNQSYEWTHQQYNYRNLFSIVMANREVLYLVVIHRDLRFEFYRWKYRRQKWMSILMNTYNALMPSSTSFDASTSAKPCTFACVRLVFNNWNHRSFVRVFEKNHWNPYRTNGLNMLRFIEVISFENTCGNDKAST